MFVCECCCGCALASGWLLCCGCGVFVVGFALGALCLCSVCCVHTSQTSWKLESCRAYDWSGGGGFFFFNSFFVCCVLLCPSPEQRCRTTENVQIVYQPSKLTIECTPISALRMGMFLMWHEFEYIIFLQQLDGQSGENLVSSAS